MDSQYFTAKTILAIIIAYKPDYNLLKSNIKTFIGDVNKLIIWENSDLNLEQKENLLNLYNDKVLFCSNNCNCGISLPLNYAWNYARINKYNYILTMDQDSILEKARDYINSIISRQESAIYGPYVVNTLQDDTKIHNNNFELVDYVITSGCVIPVSILDKIGGYNTDFFIDGIDVELCYRAKEYGIKTYMSTEYRLIQRFGTPMYTSILGKKIITLNYPPSRLYEMVKNFIILTRTYKLSRKYKNEFILLHLIKTPIKILLAEKNKTKKLLSILSGIKDGWLITKPM